MLRVQNSKVNKMESVALHFLLGMRWTLQAVFVPVFPVEVTDPMVFLSFTFLSRDE